VIEMVDEAAWELGSSAVGDAVADAPGNETANEIREAAEYTGMGVDVGMAAGGIETAEATTALLSGGAAELGAGAAFGAGAATAAGVIGAGALGYEVGNVIEQQTGIGSKSGDALYEISDPNDALAAANHADNASEAWDRGEYGTAVVEGAETAGKMVEGVWDGLTGSGSDN
jgi:hypothetical protein